MPLQILKNIAYVMRYFSIFLGCTILILLLGVKTVLAQVDITKYASDDLFSVKPLITQEYLEENQEEESEFSSLVEMEIDQGMDYWNNGQYDDALDIFSQLADEYQEGIFYYYLGVISYERERYQEANEHLNEALRKEPLLLETTYILGMVALAENDTRKAKTYFKKLTEVPLYESSGQNGLALVAWNTGNVATAITKFKKCIDLDSTFLEAYPPLVGYY